MKCSTVCVTLLQQHHANLLVQNNLSNSIAGTCVALGHLNLFITLLQQSTDIDLGKLHKTFNKDLPSESAEDNFSTSTSALRFMARKRALSPNQATNSVKKIDKSSNEDNKDVWKWKYSEIKDSEEYNQHSLIYLIIEHDWQGALSLVLNDIGRFHLCYIQILEAAILNNKLNLVFRLLLRVENDIIITETNFHKQNLFHLLANMNEYNENLLKQILLFLHEYNFNWNISDKFGSYPLHYACVKQNFVLIDFIREKYPTAFNLNQADSFGNTASSLLFWSLPRKKAFSKEKLRLLIASEKQLDCLCNYDNEIAINPLSFGCMNSLTEDIPYPPVKTNNTRTSPLIHAIVHSNFQLAKFLLELNADPDFSDENEQTPLMYAVRQVN